MDNKRIDIVKRAFKSLDEKRKGRIPIADLLKKYNAAVHPRVLAKEKTVEEVYNGFEEGMARKAYRLI
jgi:Ca2+-binding EF-hand superfamily protein